MLVVHVHLTYSWSHSKVVSQDVYTQSGSTKLLNLCMIVDFLPHALLFLCKLDLVCGDVCACSASSSSLAS